MKSRTDAIGGAVLSLRTRGRHGAVLAIRWTHTPETETRTYSDRTTAERDYNATLAGLMRWHGLNRAATIAASLRKVMA